MYDYTTLHMKEYSCRSLPPALSLLCSKANSLYSICGHVRLKDPIGMLARVESKQLSQTN
jgi:hypothetical protein